MKITVDWRYTVTGIVTGLNLITSDSWSTTPEPLFTTNVRNCSNVVSVGSMSNVTALYVSGTVPNGYQASIVNAQIVSVNKI